MADKMGAMYMECSSKEMIGVHEIFDTAIDWAVRGQDEVAADNSTVKSNGRLGGVPVKRKKRNNCKIL